MFIEFSAKIKKKRTIKERNIVFLFFFFFLIFVKSTIYTDDKKLYFRELP